MARKQKIMKVKDLLPHAWTDTDCVAIRDCDTTEQIPQYMAVRTAIEAWGDWVLDMFSIGDGLYHNDKVLHLWVYKG